MLQERVRRQMNRWERDSGYAFWQAEDTIVAGISGGPDSLALLHMLARRGLHTPDRLVTGHLDHGLRATSGEEAEAVAALCQQWGITCVVEAVDVAYLAKKERLSTEEAARKARYAFLGRVAREVGSKHVVVGHTADDQAETILMHLVRGAGLDGLRGMLPSVTLAGFPEVALLRPLLSVTRREIENYCGNYDLQPIRDPSNEDLSFFRNRLRHELLPILESYNPQLRERLLRTAAVIRGDIDYLDARTALALRSLIVESTPGLLRLKIDPWQQLPLSLRRRTLREGVWRLRQSARDVGFAVIEQAREIAERGQVGAKSTLPGGIELEVEYDTLLLHDPHSVQAVHVPQVPEGREFEFPVPGKIVLKAGWRLRAEIYSLRQFRARRQKADDWQAYVDADLAGALHVRTRQVGERMQPLGMNGGHAKVSDIMINEKLPAALRASWPVVANDDHPVWLVGIRLDERAKVHERTQRVIQLRCEQPNA